MKILLTYKADVDGARDPFTSLLPIGLGYMNAVLRSTGYRSKLANFSGFSWKKVSQCLAAERPSVLGVSQFTHNRVESLKVARIAKQSSPGCTVVFGGPHATYRCRELLLQNEVVDVVVLGEGEESFAELVAVLERDGVHALERVRGIAFRKGSQVIVTPARPPVADLDSLPLAASYYDDAIGVDPHRQLEFLITSRGCPASCSFCSSPRFWGKHLRMRSPHSVTEEIRLVRDRYGLIYFSIRDDTFTADRQRVLEFCRTLIREKVYILWNCQSRVSAVDEEMLSWMKRAGCECIQFGVESGSERVLRALGKRITPDQVKHAAAAARKVGIRCSIYLITGVPGETRQDLEETLALLEEIKAHDGQVSPLAYYPGTAMFDDAVASGAVSADLFERDPQRALLVRTDSFAASSGSMILRRLECIAEGSSFTPADYIAQRKLLGYCHATNVMAGEMYESKGKLQEAEEEYLEITRRQPENPWGWLMVGELYARRGDVSQARRALAALRKQVPANAGFLVW